MVIYSHSKLSVYEQCPFKFKLKYIDRIEPDIKQFIEGFLGNQIHLALEFLYKEASNNRLIELDDLIKYFAENWKKNFNQDIKINKEMNSDDYFIQGVKFLINYYTRNYPFDDNTIALEKEILIKLDEQGKYLLRGFIDRLVHNKELNIIEIHDYKTSGALKTQEELDNDRQLALYCLGIQQEFNANDVHLIWHFLDFDKRFVSKRTTEQLEELKKQLIILIDEIESCQEFHPKTGKLCDWCEFKISCPHKIKF